MKLIRNFWTIKINQWYKFINYEIKNNKLFSSKEYTKLAEKTVKSIKNLSNDIKAKKLDAYRNKKCEQQNSNNHFKIFCD